MGTKFSVFQKSHGEFRVLNGNIFLYMYLQSLTVPLQGFLNAVVYSKTREDPIHMNTIFFNSRTGEDSSQMQVTDPLESDADSEMERRREQSHLYSGSFSGSESPPNI